MTDGKQYCVYLLTNWNNKVVRFLAPLEMTERQMARTSYQ